MASREEAGASSAKPSSAWLYSRRTVTTEPGATRSTSDSMRAFISVCFVSVLSPKTRLSQGIPTSPSSSWTMIVVGVSSLACPSTSEAVAASCGMRDCASPPDCASSLWAARVRCWTSSLTAAARVDGIVTGVKTRAPAAISASAVTFRRDICGSLGRQKGWR